MPDKNGTLTEDERKKVAEKLKGFDIPIPACPICGSRQWTIGTHLVQPLTLGPGNSVQLGGVGYPQVMLLSDKCGYTMFINAVILGLLPAAAPEEQQK